MILNVAYRTTYPYRERTVQAILLNRSNPSSIRTHRNKRIFDLANLEVYIKVNKEYRSVQLTLHNQQEAQS